MIQMENRARIPIDVSEVMHAVGASIPDDVALRDFINADLWYGRDPNDPLRPLHQFARTLAHGPKIRLKMH